jgi:flagellar M-ring protein FliF
MPEMIDKLRQQFVEFWSNLDSSQKNRILLTSGILFITVTITILVISRTEYETIRISDPKQAPLIREYLDENNIKYKYSQNSIEVESSKYYDVMVNLNMDPSLSGTVDFSETFSSLKMGLTESDKEKLWENFKNESIRSMILSLDNVRDVKVELAIADSSDYIFDNDDAQTTAVITLTPNGQISSEQAGGIKRLVASAIGGMDPADVTLLDNNANPLGGSFADDIVEQTNTQFDLRERQKRALEKAVLSLYSRQSSDFDYIDVQVNPYLDFNKEQISLKEYSNPDGLDEAVISEQQIKENAEGGSTGAEPGIAANTDNPSYPTTGSNNSSYSKTESSINRVFNTQDKIVESAYGEFIPEQSTMTVALWYGNRVEDDASLTQAFIDSIRSDASGATGIPINKITVNKYKLAEMVVPEVSTMETIKALFDAYGFYIPLMILIGVLIMALKPKQSKEYQLATTEPDIPEIDEPTIEEIQAEKRDVVKEQLNTFVTQKPDSVAQLLRNWLQDDW